MILTKPQGILFDIDGTLTESKQALSEEMGTLLAGLMAEYPVGIVSGASLHQFETQILPYLPKTSQLSNLFLFPTSGAQSYRYHHNEWQPLYDHGLSEEEKSTIKEAVMKALVDSKCTEGKTIYGEQLEDRHSQMALSLLGQEAPIHEKETFDPTHKIRLELIMKLIPMLPQYEIRIGGMTTIDITKKGIDKAYAVQQFALYLNAPVGQLLYIGDALDEGGNDAIVIPTGIPVRQVSAPSATMSVIQNLIELASR